ncbi:hypothetical protein D3C81_1283990 [compost metagenome]
MLILPSVSVHSILELPLQILDHFQAIRRRGQFFGQFRAGHDSVLQSSKRRCNIDGVRNGRIVDDHALDLPGVSLDDIHRVIMNAIRDMKIVDPGILLILLHVNSRFRAVDDALERCQQNFDVARSVVHLRHIQTFDFGEGGELLILRPDDTVFTV